MADDAERFGPVLSTGGGRKQLVGSADQKISSCRVTAAFSADITELWEAEIILGPAHLRTGKHLQSWEQRADLKKIKKQLLFWKVFLQ